MSLAVLSPEDLQLVCLALAEMAVRRPGFKEALTDVAQKIDLDCLFENFVLILSDRPS